MVSNNEEIPNFEVIELTCDCGSSEHYYLDSSTYELKIIECATCHSKMEL
jgi:hypothetical protein